MELQEFIDRFYTLKKKGFVKSLRKGPTGIGKTLETYLGINENNLYLPDLGEIELKAHRDDVTNLITLFTFNRWAWVMDPLEAVKKYGTPDEKDRLGLYFTMSFRPNSAGLFLHTDDGTVSVRHTDGATLVKWNFKDLEEQFNRKIPALILAYAQTEYRGDDEWFYFYTAKLLTDTSASIIKDQINKEVIMIDLRLHDAGSHVPLGKIRHYIDEIQDRRTQRFFQIAFSETVRESSNTRKGEFKLFRYPAEKLKDHSPDPYKIMISKLERNLKGYVMFNGLMEKIENKPTPKILGLNSIHDIPSKELPENSIDIVVTSPPYGDSHTTVAYGQYSRLSSEWLSLAEANNIDKKLMGGHRMKEIPIFPSDALNRAIEIISGRNHKRALEVSSFYMDLWHSIINVSKLIKPNGHSCYVVGNRTVSSTILPTSEAVNDFFEDAGMKYIATHIRNIPNKRMPSRNSPTNVAGETNSTMLNEHIVIMKKD